MPPMRAEWLSRPLKPPMAPAAVRTVLSLLFLLILSTHASSLDDLDADPIDTSAIPRVKHDTRAPDGIEELVNNSPRYQNLDPGGSSFWTFTKDSLKEPPSPSTPGLPSDIKIRSDGDDEINGDISHGLKKRQQEQRKYYITFNTCLQPSYNSSTRSSPPQLLLFISTSESNPKPGPASPGDPGNVKIEQGYGYFEASIPTDVTNVYIGVHAPNTSISSGVWNYEVAASTDAPYHSYNDTDPFLLLIDSDYNGALLITGNLTQESENSTVYQKWKALNPPFTMFAHNQNDSAIEGVRNSFCGLKQYSQIRPFSASGAATNNVDVGMTTRGLGNKPKQQFYLKGLNSSSSYYGFLAMEGNSTKSGAKVVGGGGKVWRSMDFRTKQDQNCKVLFNLTFCSELAYAVPSNPNRTVQQLTDIYDNRALALYKNFTDSLAQVPCETTSSAQYSLVRNCSDCETAYKQWLCAVVIPRCEDFSSNETHLAPRNIARPFFNGTSLGSDLQIFPGSQSDQSFPVGALQSITYANQSRNLDIDTKIFPGPYKEVLPCEDICYNLVQSCPASLNFACPQTLKSMRMSYGQRSTDPSKITCSFLGAVYNLNAGDRIGAEMLPVIIVGVATTLWAII